MTLCGSQMSRRANLALVPLTVFLLSSVGHAAPPTAITTCPFVITEPGEYYLANDLLDCRGPGLFNLGIDIQASHVHLRLDGHRISGPSAIGAGIRAIDQTDILIQGPGTITGLPDGLSFQNVDFSTVIRVTARGDRDGIIVFHGSNNLLQGNEVTAGDFGFGIEIFGSSENKVISNLVTVNGVVGRGIALLDGAELNEVHANIVTSMTFLPTTTVGIFVQRFSTQNNIAGNTALGNGFGAGVDMRDDNPDCDDNQWQGNRFDTAIPTSCIQ
jgi:parallel beta-helix repeat protein